MKVGHRWGSLSHFCSGMVVELMWLFTLHFTVKCIKHRGYSNTTRNMEICTQVTTPHIMPNFGHIGMLEMKLKVMLLQDSEYSVFCRQCVSRPRDCQALQGDVKVFFSFSVGTVNNK